MAWAFERKTTGLNYTDFEIDQPWVIDKDRWIDFMRGIAPLLPTAFVQSATQIRQTTGKLPDVLTLRTDHFCSRRFKDLVESWEGDRHFFVPVDLKRKNGERIGDYYLWTLGQDIDCVLTANTDGYWDKYGPAGFDSDQFLSCAETTHKNPKVFDGPYVTSSPIKIYVSKQATLGRHFWMGGLLLHHSSPRAYFMSDPMYEAYKKGKFTGLNLLCPVEEVDRAWLAEENMRSMLGKWREREANIRKWPDCLLRHGINA